MKIHKGVKYTFLTLGILSLLIYVGIVRYEKEILHYINTELSRIVKGEVRVNRVHFTFLRNFPAATFTLSEVYVKDTLYQKELFKAEKVFLQIDMKRLFRDGLVVHSVFLEDAALALFVDSKGYFNLAEFRSGKEHEDSTQRSSLSWMVRDVDLRNVRFSYDDTIKHKAYQFQFLETNFHLNEQDSLLQMQLGGSMYLGGLAFNTDNGPFLADKNAIVNIRAGYDPKRNRLIIHPSQLLAEEQRFALSGYFQIAEPSTMHLVIENSQADLKRVASMLTPKIEKTLSQFQIEGPLSVKAILSGRFKGGTPHVNLDFSAKRVNVKAFEQQMKGVAMKGRFDNQVDTSGLPHDTNSVVLMDRMYGKYYGLPVNLTFQASNLSDPQFHMQAQMDVSFKESSLWLHPVKYRLSAGRIKMNLDYQVKVKEFTDPRHSSLTGKLNGNIYLRNGECRLITRGTRFDKIHADIRFNNSDARVAALRFQVNNNPVEAKGEIRNFIPFLLMPGQKIKADMQVHSSAFDLEPVLQYEPVAEEKPAPKPSNAPYVLDDILNKIETTTRVDIGELKMQNFLARDVKGTIKALGNSMEMQGLSMKTCKGSVGLDGKITITDELRHPFRIAAAVRDVDVREFFYACNNFSQKTIEHHNLKGSLTSTVDFKGEFNSAFKVNPESMEGDFQIKLRNGGLYNFESLKQISKIIFKKRDFMNIQFANIDNRFSMRGKEINFERTEIASTVLSFFFQGTYSFVGNTDLSIQVPLSNLKKPDPDLIPQKIGPDGKVGASIYLRGREKDGKLRFALDLFNRYAKDKEKEVESSRL